MSLYTSETIRAGGFGVTDIVISAHETGTALISMYAGRCCSSVIISPEAARAIAASLVAAADALDSVEVAA